MANRYFVTGTDTEVGKTFVASALLSRAGGEGMRTSALKPVAAGAERTAEGWRNEDALSLLAAINQPMAYDQVNPVCLPPAIAPHIAARETGLELTVRHLQTAAAGFLDLDTDFGLVEGAGGWRVPLNRRETLADFAAVLGLPVILVVGMRLGCINHALLTAEAIAADGLILAGWVANTPTVQPMSRYGENLDTLQTLLAAPLLGEVAYSDSGNFRAAGASLRLPGELG